MKNLLLKIEQIKEEGRSPSLEETRELVREANDLLNKPWSKIKRELAELGDADDREYPDLLTLGVKLLIEIRDTKGCVTKETFAGWWIRTAIDANWAAHCPNSWERWRSNVVQSRKDGIKKGGRTKEV